MIKRTFFILAIVIITLIIMDTCTTSTVLSGETPTLKTGQKLKEADYVNAFCPGQIEYVLSDKTRIDCLTDEYAIEFDFGKKWAECIGQALYYAKMTDKKPACAIIMLSPDDERYVKRINKVDKGITVFRIKSYEEFIQYCKFT